MITTKQVCPKASKMTIYKAEEEPLGSSLALNIADIAISPVPLPLKSKNSSIFESS